MKWIEIVYVISCWELGKGISRVITFLLKKTPPTAQGEGAQEAVDRMAQQISDNADMMNHGYIAQYDDFKIYKPGKPLLKEKPHSTSEGAGQERPKEEVAVPSSDVPGPAYRLATQETGPKVFVLGGPWLAKLQHVYYGPGEIRILASELRELLSVHLTDSIHMPSKQESPTSQTSSRKTEIPPAKPVVMAPNRTYRPESRERQTGSVILENPSAKNTSGPQPVQCHYIPCSTCERGIHRPHLPNYEPESSLD